MVAQAIPKVQINRLISVEVDDTFSMLDVGDIAAIRDTASERQVCLKCRLLWFA